MSDKTHAKKRVVYRNPIYVVYILAGIALFILGALIADDKVGQFEKALFETINRLPEIFLPLFLILSTFGTIGFAILISLIALLKKRYLLALKLFLAGAAAYIIAFLLKLLDIRARPGALFDVANLREQVIVGSNGYPSGHVATATALAIILYQYVPSKYHRYITWAVVGVALSRLYLGVHLPADLLGGFAVGLVIGSTLSLLFGRSVVPHISSKKIISVLKQNGFSVKKVAALDVDARGSSPFIVTDTDNKTYFMKVVNKENFVADWLFKSWRKIIYRRLEDEAPFFSPKRQIEHESYVANLAYANGIKTPKIVGVYQVGDNSWAQMQEMIDGKSLDRIPKDKVTDKMVDQIFKLVQSLHGAHIIHRDLRTANIFIDSKNEPWLIDFGFSEASIRQRETYRDIVELIASLGVLIGSDRVVKAAIKNLSKEDLVNALSYLNYPSLSSETTRQLKMRKDLLPEIRTKLEASMHTPKVKLMKMQRFNVKAILIFVIVLLAAYFFASQYKDFQNSIQSIKDADIRFVLIATVFSAISYVVASMVYKMISIQSLPYFRTLIVQIASSFTNRLLPAGSGGLATFARFLIKEGHTQPQAAALVTINNIIGFIGLTLLTLFVAIVSHTPLNQAIRFTIPNWVYWLIAVFTVVTIIACVTLPKLRKFLVKTLKNTRKDFKLIAAHPSRLVLALIFSMLITACYASVLYFMINALGASATVLQTFIVLTTGVAAASVTPTPGGIGGAEAGLVAGLTSIGITTDISISIALAYRLVTFWLPILPGFIAFQYAMKKEYL